MADWTREFDEPIPVPKGRRLVTLRDAGDYVAKLPQAEYMTAEWQAAMFSLMLVVELNGPTMMARIGIMRAINRHVERVFDSSRKDKHWGTAEIEEGHHMKLTHRFAEMTPEKRPQDPPMDALRDFGSRRRISRHHAAGHQADCRRQSRICARSGG